MAGTVFEWNEEKNRAILQKHGVSFELAREAFGDLHRVIAEDLEHSALYPAVLSSS